MKRRPTQLAEIDSGKSWLYIFWGVFLLAASLSLWGLWGSLPRLTHDNNYPVWLNAFDVLIKSGQLFPAWIKDFWFEYGSPLFVFYPPLFFYLAEISRLLGASLVIAVKIAAGFSFLLAFFTMYGLARELWGKFGGFIAALLYLTAPYHFALLYIRGALAENLAYAWLPLILWCIYKLFRRPSFWPTLGLAGAITLLILTNIPSLLVSSIIALLFTGGLVIWQRRLPWLHLLSGVLGGIALSTFYWLPVLINQHLVQTKYFIAPPYDFTQYFVQFIQYFPWRSWQQSEYYQLGWLGWIILVIVGGYLVYGLVKRQHLTAIRAKDGLWLWLSILVVTVFLTLPVSHWVWDNLPELVYVQFPFRFLSGVFLVIAVLGGYLIYRWQWWGWAVFLILVQTSLFGHPLYGFMDSPYREDTTYTVYGDIKVQLINPNQPRNEAGSLKIGFHTTEAGYLPVGIDKDKLIKTGAWRDISPVIDSLPDIPAAARYSIPLSDKLISLAQVDPLSVKETPTGISFDYQIDQPGWLIYRQFSFPGWRVMIDRQLVEWTDWTGLIQFPLVIGQHHVDIIYTQSPGAVVGRGVSLISLVAIGLLIVNRKRRQVPCRVVK